MLKAEHLTKKYGVKTALDDISFSFDKSGIVGLLGQNGAGKSTLLRILAGRLTPNSGHVLVNSHDVLWEPELAKQYIGFLPEIPALYNEMTVYDQLCFLCKLKGVYSADIDKHIRNIAEKTGLSDVLERVIGHLSKGYRQRVGLASALTGNPEIILLDEPASGMDPVQINEFHQLIKGLASDRLVILSTHQLHFLDGLCTSALILHEGQLIKDLKIINDTVATRILHVEIAAGQDAGIKLLSSLPSLLDIEQIKSRSPGIVSALIKCNKESPFERELFNALKKEDIVLTELTTVKSELEELFLSALTQKNA